MKKNDTQLNMLYPSKLDANLKVAADKRNISKAALIRMILTLWLDSNESELSSNMYFEKLEGNFAALEDTE